MKDAQSHFRREFQDNKQNWAIDAWLRQHGVKSKHLESHPLIDDMIILLQIRNELWDKMNSAERNNWGAYWGMVFVRQFPLNKKFWKKFEGISKAIDNRQQKLVKQQSRIQQLRTLKNMDHDNEAKGSCPPESKLHENGMHGSAREKLAA